MNGFKPTDRPTVVPRLFTNDVEGLVAFLKAAFDADGRLLLDRPTELVIGDSVIMIADGGGVRLPTSSAFYIYVPNVDTAWARAVKAGAESYSGPEDMHWVIAAQASKIHGATTGRLRHTAVYEAEARCRWWHADIRRLRTTPFGETQPPLRLAYERPLTGDRAARHNVAGGQGMARCRR